MNVSHHMVHHYPVVASTHPKFIQSLHIKKGALTKKAHAAGYEKALPFAKEVVRHPEKYSSKTRKQAHLAINLQKRN